MKSALRYPTFVVLAMVVAIAIINIFVIPAFAKVFESLHAELPLMTRILMATSQFTLKWWPAMVVGCVVAWLGWKQYLKTTLGRLRWDRTKLRMPIVGDMVEKRRAGARHAQPGPGVSQRGAGGSGFDAVGPGH